MKILSNIAMVMLIAAVITACGDNTENKAKLLLQEAQSAAEKSDFDKAISLIDSLRHTYPKAIEERKTALTLYQQTYKKKTEKLIGSAMAELDKLNAEVGKMEAAVSGHRKEGNATESELSALTKLRIKRDSVKAKFDECCATMRLINKKTAE